MKSFVFFFKPTPLYFYLYLIRLSFPLSLSLSRFTRNLIQRQVTSKHLRWVNLSGAVFSTGQSGHKFQPSPFLSPLLPLALTQLRADELHARRERDARWNRSGVAETAASGRLPLLPPPSFSILFWNGRYQRKRVSFHRSLQARLVFEASVLLRSHSMREHVYRRL